MNKYFVHNIINLFFSSRASDIPNHALEYQGDESRPEKN